MRKWGLAIELLGIAGVFASFFAGEARHAWFGGGVAAIAAAAAMGAFGERRTLPQFWLWFASLAV